MATQHHQHSSVMTSPWTGEGVAKDIIALWRTPCTSHGLDPDPASFFHGSDPDTFFLTGRD